MKMRTARKVRDTWMLTWKAYQIVRRFQPEAREEIRRVLDLVGALRGADLRAAAEPAPLTSGERKTLKAARRLRNLVYDRGTLLRAYGRLPSEEQVDWYVEWMQATKLGRPGWDASEVAVGLPALIEAVRTAT